jgi:UDP-glucose 4-epimerase
VALLEGLCADPPAVVVLTSTQLVYGPTAAAVEEMTAVRPATLFAAAKAAAEAFLCAYTQRTGTRGVACRLANVVGPRARRGVISDLVGQLREDPSKLKVLGDGRQRRSFVHVDDCVSALLTSAGGAAGGWSALNVSNTDSITVAEVAGIVAQCCPQVVAELQFEGGSSWQGDATALHPDPARLLALGWRPSHTSAEAVRATARGMFGLEDPPKEPSAASAN